jgi:hypothetical protein
MEVHAHTHTPRKKWPHYFWEFLMLFLAVFCGFLAENQREHLIEHQREKQYMRTLLEDLQTDTATIKRVQNLALIQKASLDSLIELGNLSPVKKDDIPKLYMLKGRTNRFLNVRLEDRTSSQLKNAGGMRLIRNTGVSNAIREYWAHEETIYRVRDRLEMAGENIADVGSKIFFNKYSVPGKDPLDPPIEIKPGAELIDNDPKLMAEYINRVASKFLRTKVYIAELESTMKMAERLMELIKEGYHLSEGTLEK